jgi:hypothetical protein
MKNLFATVAGHMALTALTGCQAPVTPLAPAAIERPVRAAVSVGAGYQVQAVVRGYTAADINHLKLRLLARNASGGYDSLNVTRTLAPGELASPVSLGNLKLGRSYRVQTEAYADAAGTQLISEAAGSVTDFAMPALTRIGGIDTVDDTPVTLSLRVKLQNREYAAGGAFTVVPTFLVWIVGTDNFRVTLHEVGANGAAAVRFTKSFSWAGSGITPRFTLANLKAGKTYRLLAEGFNGTTKTTVDSKSIREFTLPAAADGQLENDLNELVGTLNVPCAR